MSANRQTKITLFETGDAASSNKNINTSINYQQKSYGALKKHIEASLRIKPTDPAYDVETMSFKDKTTKMEYLITIENFEELKAKLFDQTTVYMKTKVCCRASSPAKGRMRRDSQNDENNAPNPISCLRSPSPLQVRRAGSPPRRDVCSTLKPNLKQSTTALPSSPSASPSTCSVTTPNSSIRSAIRGSAHRNPSPLRAGSPLLRSTANSRHKSPGNIRRARVNSVTTPGAATPGAAGTAGKESTLRLLSRSSIKKNITRASPASNKATSDTATTDSNEEQGTTASATTEIKDVASIEDIDVGLEHMALRATETETGDQMPSQEQIITELSPVAPHHDTWKEIYTPRNSHTMDVDLDEAETEADLEGPETSISEVARNIFSEEIDSGAAEDEDEGEGEASTTTSATVTSLVSDVTTTTATAVATPASTATPTRRPSRTKEATPTFNVKEKVQQAALEAKSSSTSSTVNESQDAHLPSFMKNTRSSRNHLNNQDRRDKLGSLQWEKRLRKSEQDDAGLSRKVQSSFKDRTSKFNANMLKAIRSDTKTLMPDGRPSLDTMTAQWEFMRNQFLGSNDEALEWMMQAKSGGAPAYKHATRKHQISEDQYFKSLFEIDVMEAKLRLLAGPNAQVLVILKAIASCSDILCINPNDSDKKTEVRKQQQLLKEYFHEELKGICCQNLQKDIQAVFEFTEETKASKKARHIVNNSFPAELSEMRDRLKKSNQAKEESLTEMEKWDARVKETAEYEKVLAQNELKWIEEFREGNLLCLRQMRSLIPVNIAQLSIADLMTEVRNRGALYTPELAVEIKNNKLLHWLLMAPEDIAMTNFLSGEHRQYFVNIDGLDVVEMRALRMVLPDKFELDQDGQKAEWRERFIGRMKQLVAQQNEDSIKGGWDAESGKRSMVQLPELKQEQCRRQIYFFRTYDQMVKKLAQYADKAALLDKKQKLLEKATEEEKSCRDEYNVILEESRDPYFRSEVGLEQLNVAKAEVKNELKAVEGKRKYLQQDVTRLLKSISDMSVTQEEYAKMIKLQGDYLNSIAAPPASDDEEAFDFETATDSVQVTGAFDEEPEIKRIERSSAKFQTAEQEAILRKLELSQVKISESAPATSGIAEGTDVATGEEQQKQPSAVDKSMFEKSEATETADIQTPQRPRRGSVLLSANKNVIDTLNNMFSPSGSSLRRGSEVSLLPSGPGGHMPHRNSIFSPSGPVGGRRDSTVSVGSDGGGSVTVEKKAARSKTLKKLMERKDSGVVDEAPKRPPNPFMMMGGGGGGMSFLQQIQAKRKQQEGED